VYFKKSYQGFGLMETLVAILLTGVISAAFFTGITQAKLYMESIRIKQNAFRELTNWTNQWKSMVAAGVESFPSNETTVTLNKDKQGNITSEGKLFKTITKSNDSGELATYYNISTYITWNKKRLFLNMNPEEYQDTLRFDTYQIRFNTK
tara:strand:- start:1096 stop:1545 length:450 start_codon:yes stop_codon:yes gene_type:complete